MQSVPARTWLYFLVTSVLMGVFIYFLSDSWFVVLAFSLSLGEFICVERFTPLIFRIGIPILREDAAERLKSWTAPTPSVPGHTANGQLKIFEDRILFFAVMPSWFGLSVHRFLLGEAYQGRIGTQAAFRMVAFRIPLFYTVFAASLLVVVARQTTGDAALGAWMALGLLAIGLLFGLPREFRHVWRVFEEVQADLSDLGDD